MPETSWAATRDGSSGRRGDDDAPADPRQVTVTMHVHGRHPVSELIGALSDLDYVDAVVASDLDTTDD